MLMFLEGRRRKTRSCENCEGAGVGYAHAFPEERRAVSFTPSGIIRYTMCMAQSIFVNSTLLQWQLLVESYC